MPASQLPTILVVDDIAENITIFSAILGDNYRVIFASNGADALELVHQQHVDLILLDIMMPEMSGYEVCRRLKADALTCDIPVIFVTAMAERTDEARGLELGAVDYLLKPCHADIVRLRVKLHLQHHNLSLALEQRVRERTREVEETRKEIVRRLSRAAEYRDNETGLHVVRMSKVSQLIALAAGMPKAQAELLLIAAPMHDVGKLGIPDQILLKPGRLNPQEWEVMKTHARIGAEIIGQHDSALLRLAALVALTHHEKWDGSGYPQGLAGEAIPLEGRIVAIADVFDALTSVRPYKRAWSFDEATAYMRAQSGISFDPRLLDIFLTCVPEVALIQKQFADAKVEQENGTPSTETPAP